MVQLENEFYVVVCRGRSRLSTCDGLAGAAGAHEGAKEIALSGADAGFSPTAGVSPCSRERSCRFTVDAFCPWAVDENRQHAPTRNTCSGPALQQPRPQ